MSQSVNRGSVVSPGAKTPYQCCEIASHQTDSLKSFENVQSQINPFLSRQYECPFIPDENEGGREGEGRGGEGGTQNKEMIAISKEI